MKRIFAQLITILVFPQVISSVILVPRPQKPSTVSQTYVVSNRIQNIPASPLLVYGTLTTTIIETGTLIIYLIRQDTIARNRFASTTTCPSTMLGTRTCLQESIRAHTEDCVRYTK